MNATEIRNEIRRLEESGRRCTTERDAHLVDQEIVRLEAELRGLENGTREAARCPRTREGAAPGQDAKVARRRALAWRLAHRVACLGAIVNEAPDTRAVREEIRDRLEAIRVLAQEIGNTTDPNYA